MTKKTTRPMPPPITAPISAYIRMLEPPPGLPTTSNLVSVVTKVLPSTLPPLEETTPSSKVKRYSISPTEAKRLLEVLLMVSLSPSRLIEKPKAEEELSSFSLPSASMTQTSTPLYCSIPDLVTLPSELLVADFFIASQIVLVEPYSLGACIFSEIATFSPLNFMPSHTLKLSA